MMTFQVRVENEGGGRRNWIITGHFSFPIPRFFERASVESKTCEVGSLVDAGKRFPLSYTGIESFSAYRSYQHMHLIDNNSTNFEKMGNP